MRWPLRVVWAAGRVERLGRAVGEHADLLAAQVRDAGRGPCAEVPGLRG